MKEKIVGGLAIVLLISGFFLIPELLIGLAKQSEGRSLFWLFCAAIYMLAGIWSEVYFFDFIIHRHWWKNRLMPWWHKHVKINFGGDHNGRTARRIARWEYLGLLFSTSIVHTGKIGAWVFVSNRAKLPRGLWFLCLGGLIRIGIEYLGISLLLQVIKNF